MTTETRQAISAQVAAKFGFSVDKFPLSGPDGMKTPFYGLFRSDTAEVVHDKSVSFNYTPHTTDDVVTLVECAEEIFGDCSPRCHFRKGHYVELAPSRDQRLAVYGTRDNVFPRMLISAGYNGDSFRVTLGYYRDLCRNLAMMSSVSGTSVSIRHDTNLRTKMDELVQQMQGLRDGWSNLQDTIVRMESAQVSLSSFMERMYGEPPTQEGSARTRHENRTASIVRRVIRERNLSGRPAFDGVNDNVSWWEAYNAVQGYSQHDQSRRGTVTAFDRELLANNSQEVKRAERMAITALAA